MAEKLSDKIAELFTSNPFKSRSNSIPHAAQQRDKEQVIAAEQREKDKIKRSNSLKHDKTLRSGGSITTSKPHNASTNVNAHAGSSHAAGSSISGPPSRPPVTTSFRRLDIGVKKEMSTAECLTAVNTLLGRLRAMSPNDIRAFPLLNESQRLVQQLKDATKSLQAADKDAWLL